MAANIQKIIEEMGAVKAIKQARKGKVFDKLAAILANVKGLIRTEPSRLQTAEWFINSSRHNGVAIRNVSSEQKLSKTHELILFCHEKLVAMQDDLDDLIADLALNPIDPSTITTYCERFLRDYGHFESAFCLLLEAIRCGDQQGQILNDLKLLEKNILALAHIHARQTDEFTLSTNEPIFSMDNDDFADFSSSSYDSPALSTTDSSPQKPKGSDKKEKAEIYTPFSSNDTLSESLSSKVEPPKRALSAQRQDSASPKEEKPQDAISLLSEMLRQAKYLREAIWFLCCEYKSLHCSVEDEHYKIAKSKLDSLSKLIHELKRNLRIRTEGHIRSMPDFYDYKKTLKSQVEEIKAILQDPALKKEMEFIYSFINSFINSKPVNHNAKLKHSQCEVYYTAYTNRNKILESLCAKILDPNGMVGKDIARIRAETNGKIIVNDVFAAELEMGSPPSCSEIEESSSQLPSPPETTSDEKEQEENFAGAYSDRTTPLPIIGQKLSPITFFKESAKEQVAFKSELEITDPSQPPEQIPENHQEEQKEDTVSSNQNASGQNGLIYRSLSFSRK